MGDKYSFYFTPRAEQDIDSALEYVATVLCNTKAALDLLEEIEKGIAQICAFPFSSADCRAFLMEDLSIRHIPIANYVLVYEIKEKKKQIHILRFCYMKMNLSKLSIK